MAAGEDDGKFGGHASMAEGVHVGIVEGVQWAETRRTGFIGGGDPASSEA